MDANASSAVHIEVDIALGPLQLQGGGCPALAALAQVRAPTLLIVGSNDTEVIALNRLALAQLRGTKAFELVPQAGHLFEEPGTLAQAARLAVAWFDRYLHAEGARR
jgi:putative phosphoribosyl transferase